MIDFQLMPEIFDFVMFCYSVTNVKVTKTVLNSHCGLSHFEIADFRI